MKQNKLVIIFLSLFIVSKSVFALKTCELNSKEIVVYNKILTKVKNNCYDEELFNLIPDDYKKFQKLFIGLMPKADNNMRNQNYTNNMNKLIGEKEDCYGKFESIDILKFINLFQKMKKTDKNKVIQKSVKILAGPWTGDNFLEFDESLTEDLFDTKDKNTLNFFSSVDSEVLKGLIMRYNTTNRAHRKCDREYYGKDTFCPIEIPDYALQMPKKIQERFEKAKEELLK